MFNTEKESLIRVTSEHEIKVIKIFSDEEERTGIPYEPVIKSKKKGFIKQDFTKIS